MKRYQFFSLVILVIFSKEISLKSSDNLQENSNTAIRNISILNRDEIIATFTFRETLTEDEKTRLKEDFETLYDSNTQERYRHITEADMILVRIKNQVVSQNPNSPLLKVINSIKIKKQYAKYTNNTVIHEKSFKENLANSYPEDLKFLQENYAEKNQRKLARIVSEVLTAMNFENEIKKIS